MEDYITKEQMLNILRGLSVSALPALNIMEAKTTSNFFKITAGQMYVTGKPLTETVTVCTNDGTWRALPLSYFKEV